MSEMCLCRSFTVAPYLRGTHTRHNCFKPSTALPLVKITPFSPPYTPTSLWRTPLLSCRPAAAAGRFGTLLRTHGLTLLGLAALAITLFGITGHGASSLSLAALPNPIATTMYVASVVTIATTLEVAMCAFKAVLVCFLQMNQSCTSCWFALASSDGPGRCTLSEKVV